jgi:hypothetical protein
MVYLHEIALPDYKTVTGSLGFVSLGVGVVIGICVVASVIYTVPAGTVQGGLPPACKHAAGTAHSVHHDWQGGGCSVPVEGCDCPSVQR